MCRGAAQVMFQRSVLAGSLMLAGILVGSFSIGGEGRIIVFVGAALALAVTTALAEVRGAEGRDDGLCGFNAVLVGCAVFTFFNSGIGAWLLLLNAALLTLPLKRLLDWLLGGVSYTFSFIIVTWFLLALGRGADICSLYVPESIAEEVTLMPLTVLTGLLKGISEVFLIDSWVAGLLFIAALLVSVPSAVVWALVGSAGGMFFAWMAGCPDAEIADGLWGFSPALTAIAVGTMFPAMKWRIVWVAGAVALTFVIQYVTAPLFVLAGLPVLTMPFCVATCFCRLLYHFSYV